MRVILGPCRCQGCGRLVWWATWKAPGYLLGQTAWRHRNGLAHRCAVQ